MILHWNNELPDSYVEEKRYESIQQHFSSTCRTLDQQIPNIVSTNKWDISLFEKANIIIIHANNYELNANAENIDILINILQKSLSCKKYFFYTTVIDTYSVEELCFRLELDDNKENKHWFVCNRENVIQCVKNHLEIQDMSS